MMKERDCKAVSLSLGDEKMWYHNTNINKLPNYFLTTDINEIKSQKKYTVQIKERELNILNLDYSKSRDLIDSGNENDFSKLCTKKIRSKLLNLGYNAVSWTDDKGKKLALLKPELILEFQEV